MTPVPGAIANPTNVVMNPNVPASQVELQTAASMNALLALHRNDIPGYFAALADYRRLTGGATPFWAWTIVLLTLKDGSQRLVNLNSFYGMSMDEILENIS